MFWIVVWSVLLMVSIVLVSVTENPSFMLKFNVVWCAAFLILNSVGLLGGSPKEKPAEPTQQVCPNCECKCDCEKVFSTVETCESTTVEK